ncbi:Secondary metabolism regulator LAE1 [Colletotrichum aenigma]|uniref:Secondary metabolism regulator LAE1 n=1 Tax=Colletotrichum aenigma TaxID=1215731 RepID=UPI001872EE2D|nr:Secondary metabolism regulator LAE1 [Colletotrichum aenigma]KAF5525323.1 Secondary metabolism regulator LAE1 [Colletotrichum aenigma]
MSANNATSGATGTAEVPVQANNPINLAADEATNDTSSEIGGSVASSTASLSDSIRDFRVENGRTYHKYKDGRYHAPNDERENERLDLQHHLCLLTLDNRLGLAPANGPNSKVTRVLDVGTGTGIWAEDFGEEHPDAEVIGFDLSPTMSDFVPPNVKFEVDDLDEEWNWSQPFDYIHSRFMNASIGNWQTFATKVFNHLTPGGYVELVELDLHARSDDGTLKSDSAISRCTELLGEAAGIFGRPYQEIPPLVKVLEDAGFVDVKMEVHKWPTNDWPKYPEYKELGIWANENFIAGFESFTMAPLTRAHGWTKEEVQVFLVEVRKDLGNRSIHAYWPMYNIYGRKPSEKKQS